MSIIHLYGRRFARLGSSIAEGFAPLGHFLKRQVLGLICDHDFVYSKRAGRRVCRCGATRRV